MHTGWREDAHRAGRGGVLLLRLCLRWREVDWGRGQAGRHRLEPRTVRQHRRHRRLPTRHHGSARDTMPADVGEGREWELGETRGCAAVL